MTFTEEDVPLMKLIFNPETHDMGMMVGRERANEIFEYVCNKIKRNKEDFIQDASGFFERILNNKGLCYFFWDNNILQITLLDGYGISWILRHSPIAEKIWDSGKLDLSKLGGYNISCILRYSPVAEKIWDSGSLDLSMLRGYNISDILRKSSIAEKIWDSRKLDISLLSKKELGDFKRKFDSI